MAGEEVLALGEAGGGLVLTALLLSGVSFGTALLYGLSARRVMGAFLTLYLAVAVVAAFVVKMRPDVVVPRC